MFFKSGCLYLDVAIWLCKFWIFWSYCISSDQFSRSVVSYSLRPHESQHARPPCPSPTPGVHSNPHPLRGWCHPAISSSVLPSSSCPQSLPASESFPMSQLFASGGQRTGVSALASFLPKNTQDWSPDLNCHFGRARSTSRVLVPCMFPALSNTRGLGKPLKPPLLLSPGHTPTLIPYKDIPQAHPLLGEQGNLLLVLTFLRCSRNTTKPCLNFLSGF